MKKIWFLIFTVVCLGHMFSQTTFTTYYVKAPTAGCNGIWAVNMANATSACGNPPYSYSWSPSGCGTTNWTFSLDTTFIPLCSVPCNLTITNGVGIQCGLCGTLNGGGTGIQELSTDHFALNVFPNPVSNLLNIKIDRTVQNAYAQVINLFGQSVYQQFLTGNSFSIDVGTIPKGIYFVRVTDWQGKTGRQKVVVQ